MLISHHENCINAKISDDYVGYEDVFAKTMVGKEQGWKDYTMKLFEIKPNGHTDKHSHEYIHVMYVVEGQGIVYEDDKEHVVRPGSFVYFTPNVEHQITNPNTETLRYIFVTSNYDVFIAQHK